MNKPKKISNIATVRRQSSGLGLGEMGDLSALLDTPSAVANSGGPLLLDMELIDEDPHQPRTEDNPGFSEESLNELAASIRLRGVKTPISVRDNPSAPGRYIINHGARRFRGSKRADKKEIPVFIDNDYNEADQVVENLQRNELTAREIADYIGRELAKGIKKGDIAKSISKSPAFVSQHVTLLDLPDPIAQAFNSGRVKDVTVINELVTGYTKKPDEVTHWLGDENQEITRGSVKLLREFLDEKRKYEQEESSPAYVEEEVVGELQIEASDTNKKGENPPNPQKLKKTIVQVKHNDRPAQLMLSRRPPAEGFAWLKYDDDGQEIEASLSDVTLIALVEG
jgi:ParB family chromosome partitioning protein